MLTDVSRRSVRSRATTSTPERTPARRAPSAASGPSSVRIDARSTAARANPAASTHSASTAPTSPIRPPPSAGPIRKPSDQTSERLACPSTKCSSPTSRAVAPNAAASTNTRPAVTPMPAAKMSARGRSLAAGPTATVSGSTHAATAWSTAADTMIRRRPLRSPSSPACRPSTRYGIVAIRNAAPASEREPPASSTIQGRTTRLSPPAIESISCATRNLRPSRERRRTPFTPRPGGPSAA